MTKKELLEKLVAINEQVDDLDVLARNLKETTNTIRSLIDEIPDEESEITDKEEEE